MTRTVWQTVRRITNEILGVKGLREKNQVAKMTPLTPQSDQQLISSHSNTAK